MVIEKDKADFRSEIGSAVRRAIVFLFVQIYFWLWSWKKDKAKYFKYSALAVLSLSTISLALEVGLEMAGTGRLTQWIGQALRQSVRYKIPASVVLGLFLAAVIYMVVDHYREARKPDYEFNFAMRLCECIESQRILNTQDPQQHVKRALELTYSVFRSAGAKHATLHTPEGGDLVIRQENVFPAETHPDYFVKLKPGEGVAGHVYSDQRVRYMPRVRLFWWDFPHAVNFDYSQVPEPRTGELRYEFVERRPDYFLFQPNPQSSRRFEAFLSVPVRLPRNEACAGVLSIDFDRKDPIDKADIVMAAVFGIVLADKLLTTADPQN